MSENVSSDVRDLDSETGFAFGSPVGELYREPAGYDPSPELESAVRVALLLGLPLLLTGDPGCGKTSVAHWLAWKLHTKALVYNVKSLSTGRDLLYEFDELARFRDANAGESRPPVDYLRLNALGLAILYSASPDTMAGFQSLRYSNLAPESEITRFASRQVVLIDELDKAPRDTPNDLLSEFDEMKFRLRELNVVIEGKAELRPAVVITSNSEKSLPEPFLRRCVFHHISAPDDDRRRQIVARRQHPFAKRRSFDQAMRYFERLNVLSRAPGIAELLAWLTALDDSIAREEKKSGSRVDNLSKTLIRPTLGTLAKTKEDLELAEQELKSTGLG